MHENCVPLKSNRTIYSLIRITRCIFSKFIQQLSSTLIPCINLRLENIYHNSELFESTRKSVYVRLLSIVGLLLRWLWKKVFQFIHRNHLQLWDGIFLRLLLCSTQSAVLMQLFDAYDEVSLECGRRSISFRLFSWSSSIFQNIPSNICFSTLMTHASTVCWRFYFEMAWITVLRIWASTKLI